MVSLTTEIKANAYKTALEKITGVPVQVMYRDNKAVLYWTKEDSIRLQNYTDAMISKKPSKPSDIDIEIESALRPYYLSKILPPIVLIMVASFLFGRVTK